MKTINLGDTAPFGRGTHRECYRHPESPELCIKVMTEDWKKCLRRTRAHWLVRLCRPKWYFHENLAEFRFYQQVERRVGEAAREFIPKSHEIVMTDHGEGLVVDFISDFDGQVSQTLVDYLWNYGLTAECEEALNYFWVGLEKLRIFTRGRPDNVVVQKQADGGIKIIAIDGFGLSQLIPIAAWSSKHAKARLKKWQDKQQQMISKALELRKSGRRLHQKGVIQN